MTLRKWISKRDAIEMLEIAQRGHLCKTEEEFQKLLERLKDLVLFDSCICGSADIKSILQGEAVSTRYVNMGYPEEYLNTYMSKGFHRQDIVLQELYRTFELQNFKDLDERYKTLNKNPVTRLSYDFGLGDGFAYGICAPDHTLATTFLLAAPKVENNPRSQLILKNIVPHLSEALKRLVPFKKAATNTPLTPRETEVLRWLKEGRSSWEISMILDVSERAINFHAGNILKKLNAANRTHAVAIGFREGILEI